MINTETQNDKIIRLLYKAGRTLTSREARSRYRIGNLRARVCELRQEGFNIVSNMKMTKDGTVRAFYSLGQ